MTHTKPHVLLVDDNDTDNLISRRVLEINGYAQKITVSNSGKGALSYIEEHLTSQEELPDVIFLDINMPIVDGFVFLYEFDSLANKISKKIEIIVLSSSDSQQDIERMIKHPRVVKFITKPISSTIVQNLIEARA
jgi:CheY-like chemotaxis protein